MKHVFTILDIALEVSHSPIENTNVVDIRAAIDPRWSGVMVKLQLGLKSKLISIVLPQDIPVDRIYPLKETKNLQQRPLLLSISI